MYITIIAKAIKLLQKYTINTSRAFYQLNMFINQLLLFTLMHQNRPNYIFFVLLALS
jgi:hypothetical protein